MFWERPNGIRSHGSAHTTIKSFFMESKKTLRICPKGHKYHKSSDCPTCPVCEAGRRPKDGFMSLLPAPARRALEYHGITQVEQLARYSEAELLEFHGLGKSSLPKLRAVLEERGLGFKEQMAK